MKKIVALGIVIAVLVAGYGAAWLWAAGQASDYVKSLATADGVTAPRVACGQFGVSGFPFGFDLTCSDATIESGDTVVTVANLKAAIEVYRPTHALVFATSPVTMSDAFTGSSSRVDFTKLTASARLDGWRIARISVVAEAPVWTDTVFDEWMIAKASQVEAHLIDDAGRHDAEKGLATLAQFVKAEGVDAPLWQVSDGTATFEGEVTNLPDDVRSYGAGDLLRRWQAAGGRLTINSVKASDAGGSFDASGTLGLDDSGRAEGQLKLHSSGVVERIEPLLVPEYKGLIVGAQAADGSYSQSLNIRAGVVFAGLVPTGMIPPLF